MLLWDHITSWKDISTVTKPSHHIWQGRNIKQLPLINSYNILMAWFVEVMWQIKDLIYSIALNQWSPNMPRCHVWLSGKLNTWHCHYRKTFSYRACQGSYIPWGASAYNFAWSLNKVLLRGHVTNQIHYISNCRRLMDTEPGKVLTHRESPLLFKSCEKCKSPLS